MLDLTLDLNSFTKIQMQAANSVENVSDIVVFDFTSTLGGVFSDLTGNGFVDFEDLTVLLANWNWNVATAEGNLIDPVDTPVNFDDLTVLLAAWTGPGASPAPTGGAAVPEPSTLAWAVAAFAVLLCVGTGGRRRRGRVSTR